ncbi:MAG TPA: hypothetical protein DDZ89_02950 [Clostridiales bacterium]|nr:hypothetical protein [Clostridiales bacterium]
MYTIEQECRDCGHFHKKVNVFVDDLGAFFYCQKCGAECCVKLPMDEFSFDHTDEFGDGYFFNPSEIYTTRFFTEQEVKYLTISKKQAVYAMADGVMTHAKFNKVNLETWNFNDPTSILIEINKMMQNVWLETENYFCIAVAYADQIYEFKDRNFYNPKDEARRQFIISEVIDSGIMELAKRLGKKVV